MEEEDAWVEEVRHLHRKVQEQRLAVEREVVSEETVQKNKEGMKMSILDRFRRGSKNIPVGATFRLTQEGREKLQDFGGDPKSRILVALETRGTSDIDEISQTSGVSRGQVERLIPTLIRGNYIQYVSATMGDDTE